MDKFCRQTSSTLIPYNSDNKVFYLEKKHAKKAKQPSDYGLYKKKQK
jgi:hypothetical protein